MAKKNENGEAVEKAPGVIDRIVYHLQNGGGTLSELTAKLVADFPDKAEAAAAGKGVVTTLKVQLGGMLIKSNKIAGLKKEKVEGRGLVYSA